MKQFYPAAIHNMTNYGLAWKKKVLNVMVGEEKEMNWTYNFHTANC